MREIKRIQRRSIQPTIKPLQMKAPAFQNSAPKTKKKSKFLSGLFQQAGGAEGILDGVSAGSAKAAQMLRNKKSAYGNTSSAVDFEAGLRDEKEVETIFGMPAVAAYTAIGVVFLLVLFVVFKAASKK